MWGGYLKFSDTAVGPYYKWESFIVKFNSHGKREWLKIDSSSFSNQSIAVDGNNNLIITKIDTISATSFYSLKIKKLSPNGNPIWNKAFSFPNQNTEINIKFDSKNNIYLCGFFGDSLVIDNITYNNAMPNTYNSFLAKLNPSGNFDNVEIFPGAGVIDYNFDAQDNIYILGEYNMGGMQLRQYYIDSSCSYCDTKSFIAKLNTVGTCSWVHATNKYDFVNASVSKGGDMYISLLNGLTDSLLLDSTTITLTDPSHKGTIYIMKFSSDGKPQWVLSNSATNSASSYPYHIAYSESGLLWVSGMYSGSQIWFGNDTLPYTCCDAPLFIAGMKENIAKISSVQLYNENSFSIFPNPTFGKFQIQSLEKTSSLSIFNLYGEKIYSAVNFQIDTSLNFQIDISIYPAGIYFLEMISEGKRKTEKIILEK
jgi:hypothetical protein